MQRAARALALALLLVAVAFLVCFPVELDDHWWHMLTGRHVLTHGAIPTTDPFSFTKNGAPWVNWEWLGGVVMVSAFDALGGSGLVALRFLAVTAALAITWRHLRAVEHDPEAPAAWLVRLLLVSLCLLVVYGRLADRPHLYALPFVAGAYHLAAVVHRRRRAVYLVGQLALMVPWVLLHPSWPLGVAVHAAVMADAWLEDPPHHEGHRWLYRLAPLGLCLPALALHPIRAYTTAVGGLFSSDSLREWRPLWEYLHVDNVPLLACLLLIAGYVAMVALDEASRRRPSTWLVLALGAGSWWFVRFTPAFALLAAPQIHRFASTRWKSWALPERTAGLATVLVAASLLLLAVATQSVYQRTLSAEIDATQNPVGVAGYMERTKLGGNVLCNELNAHAYLAFRRYPEVREYIDGRVPQLFSESSLLAYREAFRSPDGFDRLLEESATEHVVLQGLFSEAATAASFALSRRGDFELIYLDGTAMLWTKRALLDTLPTRPPIYRYVVPPLIDDAWFSGALGPQAFPRVVDELTRLYAEAPDLEIARVLAETLARHPEATDAQRAALAPLLPSAR